MTKRKTLTESLKEVLGTATLPVEDEAKTEVTDDTTSEEAVDETTAADSLHPGAAPGDPPSKFEMISKAIGAMSVMTHDDLTKWFTSAIENSKHYADIHADSKHTQNQSSIDMKPSHATISTGPKTAYPMPKLDTKEDVEAMLQGFELSEEAMAEATTLFEAAVTARVLVENARLEEEFDVKLVEAVDEISEALADQVDDYLTYVVEHFLEENKVAVESSLRNELMGEFAKGIYDLATSMNFTIPEASVDVVEALTEKVTDLEAKFTEQLEANSKLQEQLTEIECDRIVESYAEGLTLAEADKFLKLAEGVEFDGDVETFSKKLSVIKENYFKTKSTPAKTNIETESFEGDTTVDVTVDPAIARYVAAIDRVNKK